MCGVCLQQQKIPPTRKRNNYLNRVVMIKELGFFIFIWKKYGGNHHIFLKYMGQNTDVSTGYLLQSILNGNQARSNAVFLNIVAAIPTF